LFGSGVGNVVPETPLTVVPLPCTQYFSPLSGPMRSSWLRLVS
jgi:hypothetical protein